MPDRFDVVVAGAGHNSLIAGKVMKRNGQLVGVDFDRLTRLGDQARDRLYANANVKNVRL